jgi:hypothetical protein
MVVMDNGFSKGMNMYDFAVSAMTGDSTTMSAKMAQMVKEIEALKAANGLSDSEAVNRYLSGDQSQIPAESRFSSRSQMVDKQRQVLDGANISEAAKIEALYKHATEPLATKEQLEQYLAGVQAKLEAIQQMRKNAGLEPLEGTADAYRTAALMSMEKSAHFNDYPTMVKQIQHLDGSIKAHLKAEGLGENDFILVTGMEKDGSSYLANNLYAKATGVPSDRVMSLDQLKALAQNPAEAEKVLGHKRLVFLDDYKNSGQQQSELLAKYQKEILSKIKGTNDQPLVQDVIMANLAKHDLPAGTPDPINHFGDGQLVHVEPGSTAPTPPGALRVHEISGEQYVGFMDPVVLQRRGILAYKDLLDDMGALSMHSRSPVASGVITPYGMPNNNPRFMALAEQYLDVPRRYQVIDLFTRPGEKTARDLSEASPGVWTGGAAADAKAMNKILDDSNADVVVDLRGADRREIDAVKEEKGWLSGREGKKPEAVNLPVPDKLPAVGTPEYNNFLGQIKQFEDIMAKAKAEGKNVFFHCQWGQDRTGLMRSLDDVLRQGKSVDEALANWKELKHGIYDESFLALFNKDSFEKIVADYKAKYGN